MLLHSLWRRWRKRRKSRRLGRTHRPFCAKRQQARRIKKEGRKRREWWKDARPTSTVMLNTPTNIGSSHCQIETITHAILFAPSSLRNSGPSVGSSSPFFFFFASKQIEFPHTSGCETQRRSFLSASAAGRWFTPYRCARQQSTASGQGPVQLRVGVPNIPRQLVEKSIQFPSNNEDARAEEEPLPGGQYFIIGERIQKGNNKGWKMSVNTASTEKETPPCPWATIRL